MSGNTVKAVIFDMDGVLVNSEPHHVAIENRLFRQLNLNISDEEHATYMGKATDLMWKEIIRIHNLNYSLEELSEKNKNEIISYFTGLDEIEVMPGMKDLLERLFIRKITMAVASSAEPEIIDIMLSRTNLDRYFSHKVSCQVVGKSKPEPDVFIYTAGLLSLKPEECLVIEDSENGVKAAKSAGMICIAYKGALSENQNHSLADECITDFSELDSILMKYMILEHK